MHKALPLCFVLLTLLTVPPTARAQTFTNPNAWNFGARSPFGIWGIPASGSGLALNFQTFGASAIMAANDLNLATNSGGGLTLSSSLFGDCAFTGAAKINLLGSGAAPTISAPIVLGSRATSLTFDGAGAS